MYKYKYKFRAIHYFFLYIRDDIIVILCHFLATILFPFFILLLISWQYIFQFWMFWFFKNIIVKYRSINTVTNSLKVLIVSKILNASQYNYLKIIFYHTEFLRH